MGFLKGAAKVVKVVAAEATRPSQLRGGKPAVQRGVSTATDKTVGAAGRWVDAKTKPVREAAAKGTTMCPCGKKFRSNKADTCSTKCARTYADIILQQYGG